MTEISELADQARTDIEQAATLDELEAAKVAHLGRSAPLVEMLRNVGALPPEDRATVGKQGNIARKGLQDLHDERREALAAAELAAQLAGDRTDVTMPGVSWPRGGLHPLTHTRRMIEDIFVGMGYGVVEGPEVESEWYNFTALNTPEGHPARAPSDTFYVRDDVLLRTQTSPVQIRTMQQQRPPLYVISPGRVYRRDTIDATHGLMFHQVEGLAVDYGLTLADLKGTLDTFVKTMFGDDRKTRLRTHFFPFTEPSIEVDVSWGENDDQWMEILGAGMVDPGVFAHIPGYDDPGLTGFAFGIGVERMNMLRHGVPDLRLYVDNDARFVSQYAGIEAEVEEEIR